MPEHVESTDPQEVDTTRVMQVTFVLTLAVGVPVVTALSLTADLPTWHDRAEFAIRVGALVWFVTALSTYWYERYRG